MAAHSSIETPVGCLTICEEMGRVTAVRWGREDEASSAILDQAAEEIDAYFAGELTEFSIPVEVRGSEIVKRVCREIAAIPFGETLTYGDIAKKLSLPAQVIGQACGANPIPVIIPCHRVLGANGLGGFSGGVGIETKVWLLRHEGAAGLLI